MSIKEKYRANIVGHWDFRLGTISDQSGNGNDGTFVSTPIIGHGSSGRRINFDGADDWIDLNAHIANFASFSTSFFSTPIFPKNSYLFLCFSSLFESL